MLRPIAFFWLLAFGALAQDSPFARQFERLMGQPNELVNNLANFPWKAELPDDLQGLRRVSPGPNIRIGSVENTARPLTRWKHWESEDGAVWVDVVSFAEAYGASEMLRMAGQPHSGYRGENQLLLFSGTGSRQREAIGAALIASNGSLLNLGVKLSIELHWNRPLPEADRVIFDAALTRFQKTLETLARTLLDPSYVSLGPTIAPRPEALPVLRLASFAKLWSYIKYNSVYLDKRPTLNWDAVLEEYMPRIARAKDDVEYGRILERVVALLNDGHTNVYPTAVAPSDAPLIVLEPIQGKPVATAIGNLPELKAIKPGMELLTIDGTPVSRIIERDLDPYISSSTIQDRQLRRMRVLLHGPPDSKMLTEWLSPEGKTTQVSLARNGSQHRDALKRENHPRFERKVLAGEVAYIGLNDFSDPAIQADFEARFDELRRAKAWVIDLRWNGGGSGDIGYGILAHFIEAPVEGSASRSRQYNPTFQAQGLPQTWYEWGSDKIAPASGPHYQGPIYVLTSPRTCSADEDFLVPLKIAKRITIVGEPTCGSSGQPLLFPLYKATARVCTKWDRFPDGTEFVGVGILPDVPAARTKNDVVLGRDAVLETAIELASHIP